MRRITINFTEENYQKILAIANGKSISKFINDCIDNLESLPEITTLSPIEKALWHKMLAWTLESRYLIRGLSENTLPKAALAPILEMAKSKSEATVIALLENLAKTSDT